jgi:D-alanine-D-alanine ligase-like ATP-grasp enzyme
MVDIEKYPKLIKSVENLCTIPVFAKGYYGLDAGWQPDKKEYFIFEINSAPGLNERSAFEYACFIYEEMNKNG